MAASSLSPALSLLPLRNSASGPKLRPSLSFHPFQTSNPLSFTASEPAPSRIFAAPKAVGEAAEVAEIEDAGPSPLALGADADSAAPKQKIRIKLRSYWVPLIEDSCKQIMDAARNTNAKTMGPVPLPTKKRIYCVLKSPHVHKDARFHFEIRTHQRLIDILYPTAQTIDSLMQLDLPAGVDVEVKL
ncbi:ribosomal protein S10p/S20e family protein [Wolffia australiana]